MASVEVDQQLRAEAVGLCASLWTGPKAVRLRQDFYRSRKFADGELQKEVEMLQGAIRQQQKLLDSIVSDWVSSLPESLRSFTNEKEKHVFATANQKQIRRDMKLRHLMTPPGKAIIKAIKDHV